MDSGRRNRRLRAGAGLDSADAGAAAAPRLAGLGGCHGLPGSDVSDITLVPGNMVNEQNNYGSSDFDRRHRFVASYLYNLPDAYHGGSALGKKALNSWSVSGIVTLQSGAPFSIYGQDAAFQATTADLAPGRTLASAIKNGNVADRLDAYFDKTAFVPPSAFGDFGQRSEE